MLIVASANTDNYQGRRKEVKYFVICTLQIYNNMHHNNMKWLAMMV